MDSNSSSLKPMESGNGTETTSTASKSASKATAATAAAAETSVHPTTVSYEIDNSCPQTAKKIAEFMATFPNVRASHSQHDDDDHNVHHEHHEHHEDHGHGEFPPFFAKPEACQYWLPDGGGSSLRFSKSHRQATSNDLVLDLVVVFILQGIVLHVASSGIIGHGHHHVNTTSTIANNSSGSISGNGGHHLLGVEHGGQRSSFRLLTQWDHFKDTHEPEGKQFMFMFLDIVAVYTSIWANWFRIATLLNRFEKFDIIHYILFGLNLCAMLFVGRGVEGYLSVPLAGGQPDCGGFLTALVAMQGIQFVWCMYLMYWNPTFRRTLANLSINILITGSLYTFTALSVNLNNVEIFLLFDWAGKFSDMFYLTNNIIRFPSKDTCCRCTRNCFTEQSTMKWPPVNGPLMAERLELFLILCIGEAIAAADPKGKHVEEMNDNPTFYFWFILGVIMITICLKCLAIDFGEHPTASKEASKDGDGVGKHALVTSPCRGTSWILGHFPIGVGILYTAAALETSLEGGLTYWRRWALAVGTFIVTFFSTVSQTMHKGKKGGGRRWRKQTRVLFRCSISCLLLVAPLIWPYDLPGEFPSFMYFILSFLVLMLVTDRYAREVVVVKKGVQRKERKVLLLSKQTNDKSGMDPVDDGKFLYLPGGERKACS